MPDVQSTLEFLAKVPLYDKEKPYMYLPGKDEGLDPDEAKLDNLEFELHPGLTIRDMRGVEGVDIDTCGFEYHEFASRYKNFDTPADTAGYCSEVEQFLKKRFGAEHVLAYELRLRKNDDFRRSEFDVYDPLLVEGPAVGAHNDITINSAPEVVKRYLPKADRETYLKPGYRLRIMNTWRPLNAVLEDRPLAVCDARTVSQADLVPADRILPDRVGEVYYVQHNPNQEWYWLERQRNEELLVFLAFDSNSKEGGARICPHVSFANPNASEGAAKRESIETRAIVITKTS